MRMCIIHKNMILEYVQIRNLKNIMYEILAFPSAFLLSRIHIKGQSNVTVL